MSTMQQSSKAQDRTLGVWFQAIQQGQVKLPRFQRYEAWDRGRITSFLTTIINNLLVGVPLKTKLEADCSQFTRDWAQLVQKADDRLAAGEQPSLDSIWAASAGEPAAAVQQEASN